MGKQAVGGGFAGPGGMKLPFPKAVRAGDFVFVSDQTATDANGQLIEGGIKVQTRQVMDNIKAILADAGCTMADVVKCTCWIDDPRYFGRFDAVQSAQSFCLRKTWRLVEDTLLTTNRLLSAPAMSSAQRAAGVPS